MAANLYEQVVTSYPDELNARYNLGYVLMRGERCASRSSTSRGSAQHDSTDFGPHVNLATCYMQLGRLDESLAEYRTAFRLRPQTVRTSSNIVHEYAQAFVRAGRAAPAESLVRVQLEGAPDARARARRTLALVSAYGGRFAAARELFRRAKSSTIPCRADRRRCCATGCI